MPREDAKANKKGRDSFSNECRVSDEEEPAPPPTQRPTERQPPKRGQRRETACVPTCVDVGWRRRWRKKQATGEWNRPFSLRFPVFLYDFDCWQSEWMRRRQRRRGARLSQHTHRTAGMGAKRPKGERRGIFFIAKKKFGEGFGLKLRTLFCF